MRDVTQPGIKPRWFDRNELQLLESVNTVQTGNATATPIEYTVPANRKARIEIFQISGTVSAYTSGSPTFKTDIQIDWGSGYVVVDYVPFIPTAVNERLTLLTANQITLLAGMKIKSTAMWIGAGTASLSSYGSIFGIEFDA